MKNKSELESQTIQNTMLLPLWGRATASEKNLEILNDKEAIEIINNCDYDFSSIAKTFGEFGGICYVVRGRKIDDAIRNYIQEHPHASIVNIGAGLDTTFSRIDNGTINWYNLDLPDAIAFRQNFLTDSLRNTSISKSLFDTTWFDDVIYNQNDGILFVSAGVFYYFKDEQLKEIFTAIAHRFPGGEMYFDAESKSAVKKSNRMVEKTGNKGAMMSFYVNNVNSIERWSPTIHAVSCEKYFKGIPVNKQWSLGIRFMMKVSDWLGMMKFVHLRFSDKA